MEDFWNTINGSKVNVNILKDEDVFVVEEDDINLIVIHVPRADYKLRPVYVGENPYKGTYKRNHEGDYHATEHEIRAMIRDQNPDGNDGMILEYYTMDDIDKETLRKYRQILRFEMTDMCGMYWMISLFLKNLVDTAEIEEKEKRD